MNYTLNQLQIFLKVAEMKSVTKASEVLNLTQPAVSIQLRNFQDQFDIPLTEIVGKKLYVTDFGLEIAEAARKILEEVHQINHKTLAFKGYLHGRLKLSIASTGKYIMPYYLSDFINANPGVELNMDVTNKIKVIEDLENNSIDFALVSVLPTHLRIRHLDLLQNKLYLVGRAGNPMNRKIKSKDDLSKIPLIFRESGSGTRQTFERFLEKNNTHVLKKLELTSNEAVKQSILAGLGYSVMPLIGIKNELMGKELEVIPLKGFPIKTIWSLIWLEGKNHSPAAKSFLEYIQKEKDQITETRFKWYEQY